MIVVADTSPINYLVLVDAIDVLPKLYQRVLIPLAVQAELTHVRTPAKVRAWMQAEAPWLEVITPSGVVDGSVDLHELDLGEREAIALARQLNVDQIVMDESLGRLAAAKLGLRVIGTLGVLREAAQRGMIDLPQTVKRLRETRFHVSERILEDVLRSVQKPK